VPRERRAAVRRSIGGSMHFIPAASALRPSGAPPSSKSLYRGHAPTRAARSAGRGAAIQQQFPSTLCRPNPTTTRAARILQPNRRAGGRPGDRAAALRALIPRVVPQHEFRDPNMAPYRLCVPQDVRVRTLSLQTFFLRLLLDSCLPRLFLFVS